MAKKAVKKPALWSEWVKLRIPMLPDCQTGQRLMAQLKELEKRYPDPLTLYKTIKQARERGNLSDRTNAISAIALEFSRVANAWHNSRPVVDDRNYDDSYVLEVIDTFTTIARNKTRPDTIKPRLKAVTAEMKTLGKLLNKWVDDAPDPDSLPDGMIPVKRGRTITLEAVPEKTVQKRKRK